MLYRILCKLIFTNKYNMKLDINIDTNKIFQISPVIDPDE